MYNIIVKDQAEQELSDSIDYYESLKDGLGIKLLLEVTERMNAIATNPLQFPIVSPKRKVRRAFLFKFPFSIFFVVSDDVVKVAAIFHNSRDPKRWKKREY